MKPAMDALFAQMSEVLSMSLRTNVDGELTATADHAALWNSTEDTQSTPTQVQIPIFHGQRRWGTREVRFEELPSAGFFGLFDTPLYKLIAIMGAAGFFAYLFYLSRTLRYLDPSYLVPDRVRAALDQLVEGVFILDHNQCIVLVNSTFAQKIDRTPDALKGINPASFDWINADNESPSGDLPWVVALRDGERRTDVRLELKSPNLGVRVFSCNASPIIDGGGKRREVLASFDDISDIERMIDGLREAVEKLEIAHAEVRNKNEELFRLATIDPLCGALNRRAFFEKLELEFKLATRVKLQLSVVLADIDHFKLVNDDFGHAVGDAVIKDMANVLSE
jgi:PAS domain-containing protein